METLSRFPLYQVLPYESVAHFLARLKAIPQLAVFQSNESGKDLSQYSFIAWEPIETFILNDLAKADQFFNHLAKKQIAYRLEKIANLPPFQGGLAGVLSYDLGGYTEPFADHSSLAHTTLAEVSFYSMVLAFDHVIQQAYLIATGWPAREEDERQKKAANDLLKWSHHFENTQAVLPAHSPNSALSFTPLIDKALYLKKVEAAQEAILSGEIFEVNLTNCFISERTKEFDAFDFYQAQVVKLKEDFGGFFKGSGFTIASFSPERFLQIEKNQLEARPIKGTIKREADFEQDRIAAETLRDSVKDRAENTMIVDLMRNDFSKVCESDSVKVTQWCGLESKKWVHHLVSVIIGTLKKECSIWDAIRATFPAGSITGAPKRQSMKVIDRLEETKRGFYCGHLFYLSHANEFDSSILIRSLFITEKEIRCHSGGAITLLSQPEEEWLELNAKVLRLIQS